jgi:hypothetical protein
MGTQQILMIVLSVIVVGAAVAVGIQMFDTQSENLNRQAIQMDMLQYGVLAQAWYRTSKSLGGGDNNSANITEYAAIAKYLDYHANDQAEWSNPNGAYKVLASNTSAVDGFEAGTPGADSTPATKIMITCTPAASKKFAGVVYVNLDGTDTVAGDKGVNAQILNVSGE